MDDSLTRRRVLAATGVAVASLSGCSSVSDPLGGGGDGCSGSIPELETISDGDQVTVGGTVTVLDQYNGFLKLKDGPRLASAAFTEEATEGLGDKVSMNDCLTGVEGRVRSVYNGEVYLEEATL